MFHNHHCSPCDIHRFAWGVEERHETDHLNSCQDDTFSYGAVFDETARTRSKRRHFQEGNICEWPDLASAAKWWESIMEGLNVPRVIAPGTRRQLPIVLVRCCPQREDPQHRHLRSYRLGEDHPDRTRVVLHGENSGDPRGLQRIRSSDCNLSVDEVTVYIFTVCLWYLR